MSYCFTMGTLGIMNIWEELKSFLPFWYRKDSFITLITGFHQAYSNVCLKQCNSDELLFYNGHVGDYEHLKRAQTFLLFWYRKDSLISLIKGFHQ